MIRHAAVLSIALAVATAAKATAQAPGQEPLDILVLVDLSDRIDPKQHPLQATRDSSVLRVIADEFAKAVRRHGFLYSRDRLRVIYLDGTGLEGEPTVDVAEMNQKRQVVVRELPGTMNTFVTVASGPLFKPKTYQGADFWGWFKDASSTQLTPSSAIPNRKRVLILITDGYLNFSSDITKQRPAGTQMRLKDLRHDKNWRENFSAYALTPIGQAYPGVSAVLVELTPVNAIVNVDETEMLRMYWRKWLGDMKIELAEALTSKESMGTIRGVIAQRMGNP